LQIETLGPLHISRDGIDITPSAPKLRQVFALLAACANTVVVHERFIEELWEHGPPGSVATTLQTYVYQLRKMLGLRRARLDSGSPTGVQPALLTSYGGYTLSLPIAALDSYRFESGVRQGVRELEAGNTADAAVTLAEALRLWRGPALVDVELGPILLAERLRLEELRKSALGRRIDADLMMGGHGELIGELSGLLAQSPTDERFAGQLMVAFYRSNNRAQALRVYERTRANLADGLGLDPSNELKKLQFAVLNSDESLAPPAPQPAVRAGTIMTPPCHLPPQEGPLTGREDELALVLKGMSIIQPGGPPVIAVTGPPGSGKTALVVHASHEARGYFPDGQLFARLIGPEGQPVDLGDVLVGFLRALGVREEALPEGAAERSQMLRGHTADKQLLIILDDVVDPNQLALFSPVGTGCCVICACRKRISHRVVHTLVELSPLDDENGLAMLASGLGSHRVSQDPAAAHLLVAMCDGLPTALRACTDKLRTQPHWSLRRVIKWIEEATTKPGRLAPDALELRRSIERTYWSVSAEAREVFGLFTDTPRRCHSVRDVSDDLALDEYEAEALLEELVEAQLIYVRAHHSGGEGEFPFECLPRISAAGRGLPLSKMTPTAHQG
jgi:DNA-binding SARP family transcriptional activator